MKIRKYLFIALSLLTFLAGSSLVIKKELLLWRKSTEPIYNPIPDKKLSKAGKKFQMIWAEDVRYLIQTNQLPKSWDSIKEIHYYFESEEMEKWKPLLKVPIPINPNGEYKVDLLIVPWKIENVTAVLVQYDVAEIKSKNLQWEIARNLYIKGSFEEIKDK